MGLIIAFCAAIFALLWVLSRDSKRANDALNSVQNRSAEPFTATSTFFGGEWHLAVDAEREKIALIRLYVQSTRPPHNSSNDMTFVLPLDAVAEVTFEGPLLPDNGKGAITFRVSFNNWPDSRWYPSIWSVLMARDVPRLKSWLQDHVGIEAKE